MPRTLIVTNDFPPRQGGIESFVLALASRLPPEDVVVYTARMPGSEAVDDALPFRVVRDRTGMLLPTPRVAREVAALLNAEGCTAVLYGASAPLGLLAPALREAGATRQIALTHGHEVWWARMPGTRQLLRRIGEQTDVLTYLGEYTRSRIAAALSPAAQQRMVRLPPGVDPDVFRPGCGGDAVRSELGIEADRPVVISVARLVPRKGQDALIRCWPQVLRRVPDALLLLVGGGPDRSRLEGLVAATGGGRSVRLVGPVEWSRVPAYFDAANVFAMPCRTRRLGLEPEALGIVFLEASATSLPVIVGDSGGAPDACRDGETGYVVNGRRPDDIADRISELLLDPDKAQRMGQAGRAWVRDEWNWDDLAAHLRALLARS